MKTTKEIIALIDAEIEKCKGKALKLVPCKTPDQYNEWYRLLGAVNALEAIKEDSKEPIDHFKEGFQEKEKEPEAKKVFNPFEALSDGFKRKALLDLLTQGWALTELRVKEQPPKQPEPELSKLETIKVLSEALTAVNGVPGHGVADTQTHEVKKAQEAIAKRLHELIDTL